MNQASYSVQYGSSVFIQSTLSGIDQSDIVWRYFQTDTPDIGFPIFLQNSYHASIDQSKYQVTFTNTGPNLISTLEIKNIVLSDGLYTYEIRCNFLSVLGCSASSFARATLVVLTTTTTTTTTISTVTVTTIVTSNPSIFYYPLLKIKNSLKDKTACFGGNWNTVQYTLVILNCVVLVVATLLFHFSFNGII